MNPNSQFYLAFNIGYPNAFDRAHDRTGAHLMVHGDCSSRGCYAMSDEQIQEIFALGRESFFGGQKSFQVQAYPFRMTPANMAKHRNNPHMPFWRMLKEGNDHFEVTRIEPKVDVCEKRYVFNAAAPGGNFTPISFSPKGRCPVYEVPQEIASAVNDKQRSDELQFAQSRVARRADRADQERPRRRHASDLRREAAAAAKSSTSAATSSSWSTRTIRARSSPIAPPCSRKPS